MSQKIIKIGSSHGVTISSSLLELAGLKLGDEVSLKYRESSNSIEMRSLKTKLLVKQLAEARELVDMYSSQLMEIDDEA